MTRGKYAKRAADKRAELEVTTDLATYQHRVAKLTAENQALRQRLLEQEKAHKAIERRLRAERDEGLGPQITALTLATRAATEERDRARHAERHMRKQREKACQRIYEHFMKDHGLARDAAFDILAAWVGDADGVMTDAEKRLWRKAGLIDVPEDQLAEKDDLIAETTRRSRALRVKDEPNRKHDYDPDLIERVL